MRPAMGAVTRAYPRLIRDVSSAASACWMAASATATASRSLSTCASVEPERGLGHVGVGHGLVALAGGNRALRDEILEALPVRARVLEDGPLPHDAGAARRQGGPCPVGSPAGGGEVRRGIVVGGLERGGIDLVQHLVRP